LKNGYVFTHYRFPPPDIKSACFQSLGIQKCRPSWRMIASPGEEYLGIYPGGQSGNPLSEHYSDMLRKYLNHEYNKLSLPKDSDDMEKNTIESKLLIKPNGGSK
ncbi:hypothetical protein AKJ61_03190, partial [candidate division MSBL1 archaeon SCGC-AAA259B11]